MEEKLEKAFQFRHACKDFLPDKKIPDAHFQIILKAAHLSPSSFGFEPWKFLVIQNQEIRKKLLPFSWGAQKQLPNSSHFMVILARKGHHLTPQSPYIQYILKKIRQLPEDFLTTYLQFFKQFIQLDFKLKTDKKRYEWAKRQTYIPLANMMHTAALLGIDSCPIEGFNEKKINEILEKLNLIDPSEFGISVMVAFGYRVEPPKRVKVRRPIAEVLEVV